MDWLPMESAVRTSGILVNLGETIPDTPDVRYATYIDGEYCRRVGYADFVDGGGWLVWNSGSDFFVMSEDKIVGWRPFHDGAVAGIVESLTIALRSIGITDYSIQFHEPDAGKKMRMIGAQVEVFRRGIRYEGSIGGVAVSWPKEELSTDIAF